MARDDGGLAVAGRSAGRWDALGLTMLLTAIIVLPIVAALAWAINWPPLVNAVVGASFVAALFAGVGLRFIALAKFKREAVAGYSTLQDIPGLDLRDATTGAIIRAADEPVAEWSKISWFRTARRFDRYKLSR